jgi:predicted lipoprotein with Yx(FWY)xxD motif
MLFLGVAATLAFAAAAPAVVAKPTAARTTVVRVSTRKLPKLGVVLVDSRGRTLYMFVPDKRSKVTCVGGCAVVWPPVKLTSAAKPAASGLAKLALLGSDRNPAGGRVVTYDKWPLYTYVADTAPGQAKGQALNLNGGFWYVLSPAGTVIRTKTTTGTYR